MPNQRSISEIQQKIYNEKAIVLTAEELKKSIENGKSFNFEDIDVITTATKGLMSGTSAILGFRITEPKKYMKFKEIYLNGIKAFPGPAPNEYLGVVDLTVYGTEHSRTDPNYGGGHLFRDLVERKKIQVQAITKEGQTLEEEVTLDDMTFAQLIGSRHAFRNYNLFVNPSKNNVKSIFTVLGMKADNLESSFCGVGAYNPIENDPELNTIGIGSPIIINGARGYVLFHGTRSSPKRANLMTVANMKEMDPIYMGGFRTANGPEVICSIAVPIPIINDNILKSILKIDKEIPLNIVDIVGRNVIGKTTYAEAWNGDLSIKFEKGYCKTCEKNQDCPIVNHCPTDCFDVGIGINKNKCFNCGTCVQLCLYKAFIGNLGSVTFQHKKIPIVLRQSDRVGTIKLMNLLKKLIINRSFQLKAPIDPIKHT